MKSVRPRFRRESDFGLLDLLCLVLSILIIAKVATTGVVFYRNCNVCSHLDASIGSFNRVVYLLRATGGNLSDALTPEQVVAKFQAAEGDECTLTIHSILTTPMDPSDKVPSIAISKANRTFWEVESQARRHTASSSSGV